MVNKRTPLITLCTFVRLLSLGVAVMALPLFLENAALGAATLTVCIATESIFAMVVAWPYCRALPASTGDELPTKRALWRFSWPMMLNNGSEMGVVFIINLFLGRLASPEVALAAFGVVHGLVSFLFSPMRNLAQTAQTLTGSRADAGVLVRFTLHLVLGFGLLALLLFYTPLATVVLDDIMGLDAQLRAYCEPAMRMAFAMALFWALSALFRGMLAGARSTGMLALTGGLRLGAAMLTGVAALAFGATNGAIVGLSAWMLSYAAETAVLGSKLKTMRLRDEPARSASTAAN